MANVNDLSGCAVAAVESTGHAVGSREAEQAAALENWLRKAGSQAEQSDYYGAIASYNEAIALDGGCARAYGGRGLLRVSLGDRQGAMQDLQRAAQLFLAQKQMASYAMAMNYLKSFQPSLLQQDAWR